MVFSSLIFLFGFLPAVLSAYYAVPRRARNAVLLLASAIFYFWGAPRFFLVLLGAAVFDYNIARLIHRSESERVRSQLLALGLTCNVLFLGYFKYANFFLHELNGILAAFHLGEIAWTGVVLPIGISFITFEEMSYLIDVRRRVTTPAPNFPTYALFLCFFPHLIAGPIFRYHDVADQLVGRIHSRALFFEGIWRFCRGLAKKTLIADPVAKIADSLFALDLSSLTPGYAWLAVLSYTIQIYFDFSGYSDMAIGLGKMFGFNLVENFNRPYIADSITDFWRRWHISLSNWMREYLYIPLGGSRRGNLRTYGNLWIVFLLSGFWHGANWTFLLWGAFHGFFLILDRLVVLEHGKNLPIALRRAYTFLIVVFGWALFRADSAGQAFALWQRLCFIGSGSASILLTDIASNRALAILLAASLSATLLPARLPTVPGFAAIRSLSKGCLALALFFLSTLSLVNSQFHPFIYFRF